MKGDILFLAHRVPFPPDRGDKIRSWNILKALAKLAPVHVAALVDPADMIVDDSPLHKLAATLTLLPRGRSKGAAMLAALAKGSPASVELFADSAFSKAVNTILNEKPISHIYAFSGQMAQHVPTDLKETRFIMDFVDMDSAKFADFAQRGGILSRFANGQEGKRLFAFEAATARRANMSLFVSQAEADLFQAATGLGSDKVMALENGIDLDRYRPEPIEPGKAQSAPMILFTGQMDYAPNVDAVCWFAKEVLPLLPEASFVIAGRAPSSAVQALANHPQVIVTGEVPDTRVYIAAADVVVAPLRIARGVQNKVLEAMAMGKAVVASPEAAQGIDARAGRDLIVANGAAPFADAVAALLNDRGRARTMGTAARAQMERRYGWDAQMVPLASILDHGAAQ